MTSYRAFAAATPSISADSDTGSVNLGVEFYTTATAWITHLHFFQPTTSADSSTRDAAVYLISSGVMVPGTQVGIPPVGVGWQTGQLVSPVSIPANTRYRATIRHPLGKYSANAGYFSFGQPGASDIVNGILVIPTADNATGNNQGSYNYSAGLAMPNASFGNTNYWADVTVVDVDPNASAVVQPVMRNNLQAKRKAAYW